MRVAVGEREGKAVIDDLLPGTKLRLPSGNVLVLVRREDTVWVCAYVDGSKARGEVEFTAAYLLKWAVAVR